MTTKQKLTLEEIEAMLKAIEKEHDAKKGPAVPVIDHKVHTFEGKVPVVKNAPHKKMRKGTQKGQ